MKILITGANGQLGSCLRQLAPVYPEYEFSYTDIQELDITDLNAVEVFFLHVRPELVINCAAYTAVDKAEKEPESAMRINAQAPANLAMAAANHNTFFMHISTDYVYSGKSYRPYSETDPAEPASAYAISKYEGEQLVARISPAGIIIRTSWLYSEFGSNFVKTMMRYGAEREQLNVVFDQTGSPTYAADLAKTLLDIIPQAIEQKGVDIFNYSNEGISSWYDFAQAIIELANLSCKIVPVETRDYPLPAVRPFYSVMNKEKIKKRFGIGVPYWRDSLKTCITKILSV